MEAKELSTSNNYLNRLLSELDNKNV